MVQSVVKKGSVNAKLDLILSNQEKILKKADEILGKEDEIEELEKEEAHTEKSEEESLKELLALERQLRSEITHPLKKVTKKDMFKGMIGAFVGILGHFAFSKGAEIAVTLTVYRSIILYIAAAVVISIMLYYTGFRRVEKHIVAKFMPLRAIVLYSVSVVAILIVNLLFGKIGLGSSFTEIFNIVGASIVLAVLGAGTADLIGKEE